MRTNLAVMGMVMAAVAAAPSVMLAADKDGWDEKRSQHFLIYSKDVPSDFVKEVINSAEEYYVSITRDFGFMRFENWSYEERAKIYIYKDQDDYVSSARQAGWSQGTAFSKSRVIRTFPLAQGFFDTLLPHELGHIIFREFVGDNVWLPLWFEEGVAMYQEKSRRWGAHKDVKTAIEKKKFIPLMELMPSLLGYGADEETVQLFYAESASAVYFLIKEFGENRFENFCRKLKYGGTFFDSLKRTYGRFGTIEELNKAWVDSLKKK